MKKLLALAFALAIAGFAFVGCGSKPAEEVPADTLEETMEEVPEVTDSLEVIEEAVEGEVTEEAPVEESGQ